METLLEISELLPEPAVPCFTDAILNSTCGTDTACICADEALNAQARACVTANCTIRETLTTLNVTNTLCGIEPSADHYYVPVLIGFLVVTFVVVALRLLARYLQGAKFWWDDLCNILGIICTAAFSIIAIYGRHIGFGVDIWAVPQENVSYFFMLFYICLLVFAIGRGFIRLSIVLFYLRIFNTNTARPIMLVTFVLVNCLSAAMILTLIFQCTPIHYFWLRWDGEHEGTCVNLAAFIRAATILSILIDFWQLVVAIPYVIRLKISMKKKMLIAVVFMVGIGTIVVSGIRYPLIETFANSHNQTREAVDMTMISAIEMDVGVICACLPSIQVLFKYLIPSGSSQWSVFSRSKKSTFNSSTSGKPSISAGRGSFPQIKMVTTIQQQNRATESETYLPLDDLPYQGNRAARSNKVTIGAWAG